MFTAANRWLETDIRVSAARDFSTLAPRQPITRTPDVITAGNGVSGGLAAGACGNAVTFDHPVSQLSGAGWLNVNAATLAGVWPSNFRQTGGNRDGSANGYLGTADYQPLELW